MKKLTLALVAILLALTCVFAACGKKDNTPDKPADNTDTTPAPAETVKKDDLTKIAEQFKADYVANFLDLYTSETVAVIESEKSATLIKIQAATTAAEAQKAADDFFTFLKGQKTIIDAAKDLLAKVGDVALADEGAINQLKAYDEQLSAALATATSTAKKAALEAYDAATKKAIAEKVDQLANLKDAKKAADKKDGLNDKIEALKADYAIIAADTAAVFTLKDANAYEALEKEIAAFAAEYGFAVGSDAYKEIVNVADLAAAKAVLDKAYDENPVMKYMAAVIAQRDALATAAEDARWIAYKYVSKNDLDVVDTKKFDIDVKTGATYAATYNITGTTPVLDGTKTVAMLEDGTLKFFTGTKTYDSEAEAAKDGVKQAVKVELRVKATANSVAVHAEYKLSLTDALASAMKAYNALKAVPQATRDLYGFAAGNVAYDAYEEIAQIAKDYDASLAEAKALYTNAAKTVFTTAADYTDVDAKASTTGFYVLPDYKKNGTIATNYSNILKKIKEALPTFRGTNAKGNDVYGAQSYYLNHQGYAVVGTSTSTLVPVGPLAVEEELYGGDYVVDDSGTKYWFILNDKDQPAIAYTAWEYHYELDGDKIDMKEFVAIDELQTVITAAKAQDTIDWVVKYIGEGDYADSYDLTVYKDSKDKAAWNKTDTNYILYMADRALTEVADARVSKIDGKAVEVPKTDAVAAKLLSVYSVAKDIVAEQEKIEAAQAEAVKELQAAALALRTAGDVNAITDATKLLSDITSGDKFSTELYKTTAYKTKVAYTLTADDDVVIKEASAGKAEVKKAPDDIINEAWAVLKAALDNLDAYQSTATDTNLKALLKASADLSLNKAMQDENAKYADDYAKVVLDSAAKLLTIAQRGVNAKLLPDDATTGTDSHGNIYLQEAKNRSRDAGNLSVLFTDKYTTNAGFDDIYTTVGSTFLAPRTAAGDFTAFLNKVAPAYITGKTDFRISYGTKKAGNNVAFGTYLYNIDKGTSYNGTGSTADYYFYGITATATYMDATKLEAAVKTPTTGLSDVFEAAKVAYKGVASLKASGVNSTNVDAVIANATTTAVDSISEFATANNADYLNMKAAVQLFDETVIECDFLTEAYRESVLAANFASITALKNFSGNTHASTTAIKVLEDATYGNPTWVASITEVIDTLGATLDPVASIKDANSDKANYKPNEEFYALSTAQDIIFTDAVVAKAQTVNPSYAPVGATNADIYAHAHANVTFTDPDKVTISELKTKGGF